MVGLLLLLTCVICGGVAISIVIFINIRLNASIRIILLTYHYCSVNTTYFNPNNYYQHNHQHHFTQMTTSI